MGAHCVPPVRFSLQHNFLQKFTADKLAYLLTFFAELVRLLFAAEDLVANGFRLAAEGVERRVVLVLNRQTNVPILGIVLRLLNE